MSFIYTPVSYTHLYVTVIDEYKNIFITMDENKIAKYGVCLNEIDNKNWFVTTLKCGLFLCTKGI